VSHCGRLVGDNLSVDKSPGHGWRSGSIDVDSAVMVRSKISDGCGGSSRREARGSVGKAGQVSVLRPGSDACSDLCPSERRAVFTSERPLLKPGGYPWEETGVVVVFEGVFIASIELIQGRIHFWFCSDESFLLVKIVEINQLREETFVRVDATLRSEILV